MNSKDAQFELIRRCLDGEASDEELAQLEELLRKDAEFRKDYLRYLNVDSALAALPIVTERRAQDPAQASPGPLVTWMPFRGAAGWAAVAAVFLLAGVLIFQVIDGGQSETPLQATDENTMDVNDNGVAVLTRVAGLQGATTTDWRVGETIPPGTMTWDAGLLQLEFYGGATIVVEGPAEIEILDGSRVVCRSGRLRAHVPEPARGFAVLAPNFELVDLGTEFGLNVSDDGVDEVHVFEGKVELYDAKSNRDLKTRRELNAGDAMAVAHDGTSKPITARTGDFVTPSRLSQITNKRCKGQLRSWQNFRDSLKGDPRVVAYFPFDRNEDDRLLVGYGANGSSISGAIVGCEWSEGRWPGKQSLQFKRPGDRVRIEVPGEFESLSYSTWLRVDGLDRSYNSLLLTDGFDRNSPHWQINRDGRLIFGVLHAEKSANGYETDSIFNLFRLGQWVHLVTVYDADESVVRHYVNGEMVKRESLDETAAGLLKVGSATIGNWSAPTTRNRKLRVRNLNGCIDELIVFGEALDQQEVNRIYKLGRP